MRTELHKLKEVEEKVRPGEEEVWIRQAAKCSSGYDQLNAQSVMKRKTEIIRAEASKRTWWTILN